MLVRAVRARGVERAAAVALAASVAAWAAHALVDMAWEYPAVTAPVFAVLGVLAAAPEGERPGAAARRPLLAVAAVAVAATALVSVATPWLAERKLDEAADAVVARDLDAAERAAADAQSLNPLAITPLHLRAAVAEADRRPADALALLRDAVELQPRNPGTWFALGRHYLLIRRDPATAKCALDRAYAIDNFDLETLDLVRAARRELDGREVRCR